MKPRLVLGARRRGSDQQGDRVGCYAAVDYAPWLGLKKSRGVGPPTVNVGISQRKKFEPPTAGRGQFRRFHDVCVVSAYPPIANGSRT
jgi:hypothetical protein